MGIIKAVFHKTPKLMGYKFFTTFLTSINYTNFLKILVCQ